MERIIHKYGKIRIFMISFGIFAMLLIAETIFLHSHYNRFTYKGYALKVRKVDSTQVVMSDRNDNTATLSVEPSNDLSPYPFHINCSVRFLDEIIRYDSELTQKYYTLTDGTRYTEPLIQISFGDSLPETGLTAAQEEEKRLMDKLMEYYLDHVNVGYFIGFTVLGLVLLLLAHGSFFYPEALWQLRTILSVQGGEPTDYYIIMSKISGVVLAALVHRMGRECVTVM